MQIIDFRKRRHQLACGGLLGCLLLLAIILHGPLQLVSGSNLKKRSPKPITVSPEASQQICQEVTPLMEGLPPVEVPNSTASTEDEMQAYTEVIQLTDATIEMVPIPGGSFQMGSPETEADRNSDEGPQHEVSIDPFWMGKYEITWDAYSVWMEDLDIFRVDHLQLPTDARYEHSLEYQISQPTEQSYADMTFGMGSQGYPAICMTQFAAKVFCLWLTAKTGRYYRLPTEAEWEYACRAGTTTAYSFGDDPAMLDAYAWYSNNAGEKYQLVGQKLPNPWGLHDMHGNVAEWVLDQHVDDFYAQLGTEVADNPLAIPTTEYPRVVRGGSWDDETPADLRSAVRCGSVDEWKYQDPQNPSSIWYHTDATFVGFRIVRPLTVPTEEELAEKWEAGEPVFDRHQGR